MMKKEVAHRAATLLIAALGFVTALSWNEAVKAIFQDIFGEQSNTLAFIVYAVIVTAIAIFVTLWLMNVEKRTE